MRLEKKIMAILLILMFVVSVSGSAYALSGGHLVVTGSPAGQEDSIEIVLPSGFTLGELMTVSWKVYTDYGYPPHLDITLGGVPPDQSMLTAEMAYNNYEGAELDSTPSLTTYIDYDVWRKTFELSSGDGFDKIDDSTMFWLAKMGAGNDDAPYGTLADWKNGFVANDPESELSSTVISSSTLVLKLEIEVDNWVLDTDAIVDDIRINSQPAVTITGDARPPMTSIIVTPTSLDFGEIVLGKEKDVADVVISNTGETDVHVTAQLVDDDGFYAASLELGGVLTPSFYTDIIEGGADYTVDLVLDVDRNAEVGTHTAVLVFWAEETP